MTRKVPPTPIELLPLVEIVVGFQQDARVIANDLRGTTSAAAGNAMAALSGTLYALYLRLAAAHNPAGTVNPDAMPVDLGAPIRGHSVRADRLSVLGHHILGRSLYALRGEASALHLRLQHRYPKASPVMRYAGQVERRIDRLRSHLDDVLARHHPKAFDTRVYYPGSRGFPAMPIPPERRRAAAALSRN